MSDDYAALITTVIVAVLLIGTVQAYTLFKAWGDGFLELTADWRTSADNVIQARRAGVEVPAEDLAKIHEGRESNRVKRQKFAALVGAFAWLSICAILVLVEIKVLKWSATHNPKEDPQLAKAAFLACAVSIVILVGEGLGRVVGRLAIGVKRQREWARQYTDDDLRHYDEALRVYRQRQEAEPTDSVT
ncbi:hypothetical protein [Streptomyces sp. NPDC001594]|uniref:hypothetical protein n=1 Tax=Streptomyces sp. NPDC001594 TaxID=3364590 RepID=UPI0036AAF285